MAITCHVWLVNHYFVLPNRLNSLAARVRIWNLESDKKRSSLLVYDVFVWLRVKGLAARAVDLRRQELSKPANATLLTTVFRIASEISVCLQGSALQIVQFTDLCRSLSASVSLGVDGHAQSSKSSPRAVLSSSLQFLFTADFHQHLEPQTQAGLN
jgi:hypothetical protein